MSVCEHCKIWPHSGKPKLCKGGTWCDCAHRLTPERMKELESNGTSVDQIADYPIKSNIA